MKQMLALAAAVTLSACAVTSPVLLGSPLPPLPVGDADTCNATQYAALIGQDATALERVLLMGQVRVIRPGDAVTMDFRPERINFYIDAANRIERIACT